MTAGAVAGLSYVGVVSMVFGFFAWYHAMALGGVARVGRLQVAQPALTLVWSALLLGEHVSLLTAAASAAVIVAAAVGRNARVDLAPVTAVGSRPDPAAPAAELRPAAPAPELQPAASCTSQLSWASCRIRRRSSRSAGAT